MNFQKILVPTDFSSHSLRALETTINLFPEAKIYWLYVVETKLDILQVGEVAHKFQHDSQDAAYTKMTSIIKKAPAHNDITSIVDKGKPVHVILDNAKKFEADLVVLGSHGSDSMSSVFFGSTTYQVSRRLECSTLIIR